MHFGDRFLSGKIQQVLVNIIHLQNRITIFIFSGCTFGLKSVHGTQSRISTSNKL